MQAKSELWFDIVKASGVVCIRFRKMHILRYFILSVIEILEKYIP